ncbi:MAG: NRDE family protein [Porticoccaceae bacterium]
MCLIVFAYKAHPSYPLVVVANRDEAYDRPTRPADFWPDQPDVLGGRDLLAGGTWFGVNRDGRWATVTNFREGRLTPAPRSRGELPTRFLADGASTSPARYARWALDNGDDFSGFSLLAGTLDELVYCANAKDEVRTLAPGIYTLSNDFLDVPWPKAELARKLFTRALDQPHLDTVRLMAVLGSRQHFPDHLLPETGLGLELERTLSPPFIVGLNYGTRCTTVLSIDNAGEIRFAEQNFLQGNLDGSRQEYRFPIPDAAAR